MVTFVLHSQDDNKVEFYYYPENDRFKNAGVIEYSKQIKDLKIKRVADIDWITSLTKDEEIEHSELLNKREQEQEILQRITLIASPRQYAHYGSRILEEIYIRLEHGELPKEGKIA